MIAGESKPGSSRVKLTAAAGNIIDYYASVYAEEKTLRPVVGSGVHEFCIDLTMCLRGVLYCGPFTKEKHLYYRDRIGLSDDIIRRLRL